LIVQALWESYYESVKHKPSGKVRQYYWNKLQPFFGQHKVSEINEQLCRSYYEDRIRSVSPSTIWGELSLLRTCLNFGRRKRLIEPYSFDVWLPTPNRPRDRRLTKEQVKKVLDKCIAPHTKLFVLLLISTACRASAALDLTWDRVDFNSGLIDLRKPVDGQPEGKGRAVVPMTQSLRTALLEAKEKATTPYVIEYAGQRIKDGYNGFKRACVEAGVPWAHPHILRHSAATWMAEDGIPMPEIARFLGHSDSIITERIYAKYRPNYLRNAASSLEI